MKEIIITKYQAFDGEVFDCVEDCKKYEEFLTRFSKNFIMCTEKLEKTNNFYEAWCIYAKTDEAAKDAFDKFNDDYITPWENRDECCVGKWIYEVDRWLNLDALNKKIDEMLSLESEEKDVLL